MAATASHSAGGHHGKSKPGKLILWALALVIVLVGLAFIISKASKNSKPEPMAQTSMATAAPVITSAKRQCPGLISKKDYLPGESVSAPNIKCDYTFVIHSGTFIFHYRDGTTAHITSKTVIGDGHKAFEKIEAKRAGRIELAFCEPDTRINGEVGCKS